MLAPRAFVRPAERWAEGILCPDRPDHIGCFAARGHKVVSDGMCVSVRGKGVQTDPSAAASHARATDPIFV